MRKITHLLLGIGLLLGFFGNVTMAQAAKEDINGSIQYSVNKISPGKEVDPKSSFYDLKVKPGQRRQLSARIYNATKRPITVKSQIFTTFTNDNGQISYTQKAAHYDAGLKNKLSDFTTIRAKDRRVTVPAKSNRVVQAVVNVPKDAKGVMLGSWYFEKTGQNGQKSKNSININHKYSYALAIKLTTDEIKQPQLKLGSVKAGLRNYRKAVLATIQNPKPAVVSKLKVQTEVFRKGGDQVLFKNKSHDLIMAPNSNFQYPTFLGKNNMQAGEYTLKMTATTKDSKWATKTWHWSRDFTITDDQARQTNRQAKNDPATPISIWWYVLGVVAVAGLVGGIVYLIMKRRRH